MGPFLEVKQIRKSFGATVAMKEISFTVQRGAVHAIIGENGAGKSTLIKTLCGLITPDQGELVLNGAAYSPTSIVNARAHGVSTAFQELSLLPNLTVAENLALPRLRKGKPLISKKANEAAAKDILQQFDLAHLSPSTQIGELSLAERQKVEIARAFSHRPKLLLLDEPTAALPDPEWLFGIMEKYKDNDMTILYISHRLGEVRQLCQSGTVLRSGTSIGSFQLDDVTDSDIFQMMIGDAKDFTFTSATKATKALEPGIAARNVSGYKVDEASFTLHKGEILGVAGLEGQGQLDLFKMLAGVAQPKSGQIEVDGKRVKIRSPQEALRHSISFVPEERKTEGILPGLSTLANITVSSLAKVSSMGLIGSAAEYKTSLPYASRVDLETRYLDYAVDSLSGGNQQKAIMARTLLTGSRYLLIYDPSRGVDIPTKHTFYEMIHSFTEQGGAVLWYSTDLSELVNVCDRVLVFYKGRIVHEAQRDTMTMEALIAAATGHSVEEVMV